MLHLNGELSSKKDTIFSFLDLGSLDLKYFEEPRSLSPIVSDLSKSPKLSSPPVTSTPIPNTSVPSMSMFKIVMQPLKHNSVVSRSKALGINKTPLLPQTMNIHSRQPRHQQHNIYRENLLHQQHSFQIEAQEQPKNEISESLKLFAMLGDYKNENGYIRHKDSLVDDIMKDFYCNGYVADDLHSFQEEKYFMESPLHNHYRYNNDHNNNGGHLSPNSNCGVDSKCNNNILINDYDNMTYLNSHYLNQDLWMFQLPAQLPNLKSSPSTPMQHVTTAAEASQATTAAAANIYYNNQNIKRSQKRYGSTKFDKYSSVKHCVFCENNNEPEAVVKSHAVRDSFGRVLCPKLRTYICPICKASGDEAHTVKYCPQKPIITMEDAVRAESLRLTRNTYYKQGMNA